MTTDIQSTRRWRRRNAQEWRVLLGAYDRSGLSLAEFCAREGVSQASLSRWRGRLSAEREAPPPPPFLDLGALAAPGAGGKGRLEIRLDLGQGLTLTLVRG